MALLDDLMRAGQTPWAMAQQSDWQNPGANMAQLPAQEIMKLLGMGGGQVAGGPPAPAPAAPQAVQRAPLPPPEMEPTASGIGKAFPQGGSGVLQQYGAGASYQPGAGSDVKVSEVARAPPAAAAPTPAQAPSPAVAPPVGVGAPMTAKRPDFSMPTQGSDFLGGLLQGMGGMAKPIGELVSSQSGRTRATQSSNQTYDWLMRQGMSPQDAEFVTRNPNVLKAVLGQKFAVGKYGKAGAVFEGPDKKFYTIQFGEDGSRKILPVETPGAAGAPGTPLAPAKGVKMVDDGTGTRIVSGATGDDVRRVEKDIVGRERQEKEGQALGELRSKLPTLKARMKGYEDKSTRLDETIDRAISRIGVTTTGLGGALLQNLPMTEARALRGDLDTIRANVGFDELQAMRDASPTGGALGQVSNQENTLLQSVRAAIDQLLEGKDLEANLRIIKKSNQELREIQRQKLAEDEKRALGDAPITGTPSAGGWSIKRIE